MKKALDGYVDISSLTNVQKDCLIAISQANGYDTTSNDQERKTLALYSELDYCLAQTLSMGIEQFALRSRPIISIEDFLSHFAPEWATGVCTREQLDRYWWVDDKNTYQDITGEDKLNFADDWQYLQARRLFSFVDATDHSNESGLESYKDFCKGFGGSISVNDEYYTYYTDGDEYYEFTSLEAFEGFLRDYEGFFDKYSANMQQ